MTKEIKIGNPYLLQFNLLTDCIFHCNYCYLNQLRNKNNPTLSFKDFKKFIDYFESYYHSYGLTLQVDLTGGDIWIHPEFESVITYTHQKPYVKSIGLMINSLWHQKALNTLNKVKDKLGTIQLNIDALNKRPSDLTKLKKINLSCAVKIMISNNLPYFLHQLDILRKLKDYDSNLIVAIDRICPVESKQLKDIPSLYETIKMINEVKIVCGNNFVTEDPLIKALLGDKKLHKESSETINGCAIPNGGLSIFPDGSIKLCSRIPNFNSGYNVHNFNLDNYIQKYQIEMSQRHSNCKHCSIFELCQGGCPATSFISENNKINRDINCL